MRRLSRLAVLAPIVIAACAPPPAAGFRNPAATIASAALFDAARFADVWQVVAAYGAEAGCGPLSERWMPAGPGRFRVTGLACGPRGPRVFAADARVVGPGRIARDGPGGTQALWVLWADADYRIAVIGTPDGRFGRILARRADPPSDLVEAAREVLEFNGYDLAGLRMI